MLKSWTAAVGVARNQTVYLWVIKWTFHLLAFWKKAAHAGRLRRLHGCKRRRRRTETTDQNRMFGTNKAEPTSVSNFLFSSATVFIQKTKPGGGAGLHRVDGIGNKERFLYRVWAGAPRGLCGSRGWRGSRLWCSVRRIYSWGARRGTCPQTCSWEKSLKTNRTVSSDCVASYGCVAFLRGASLALCGGVMVQTLVAAFTHGPELAALHDLLSLHRDGVLLRHLHVHLVVCNKHKRINLAV